MFRFCFWAASSSESDKTFKILIRSGIVNINIIHFGKYWANDGVLFTNNEIPIIQYVIITYLEKSHHHHRPPPTLTAHHHIGNCNQRLTAKITFCDKVTLHLCSKVSVYY